MSAGAVVAVSGLAFESRIAAGPGVRTCWAACAGAWAGRRRRSSSSRRRARTRVSAWRSRVLELRHCRRTHQSRDSGNLARRQQRRRAQRALEGRCGLGGGAVAATAGRSEWRSGRRGRNHQKPGRKKRVRGCDWRVRRRHRVARDRGVCRRPRCPVRCISRDRRPRVAGALQRRRARNAPRRNGQSARGTRLRPAGSPPAAVADAERNRRANRLAGAVTRPSTPRSAPGLPGSRIISARRAVRTRIAPAAAAQARFQAPSRLRCRRPAG